MEFKESETVDLKRIVVEQKKDITIFIYDNTSANSPQKKNRQNIVFFASKKFY
jgi:hypothetical protein